MRVYPLLFTIKIYHNIHLKLKERKLRKDGVTNKLVMPEALTPSGVEATSDSESVRPCSGLRVDLKRCLLTTDCCRKRNKTPLECLQASDPTTRPLICFYFHRAS